MDVQQVLREAQDTMTVRRVFAEPYERDGVTVIPAASIRGGGGGGGGEAPNGQGSGSGGGFGLMARPAGAYVIKGGEVTWQPATDVNRAVTMVGVVAVVALLSVRSMARARTRARTARAVARQRAKTA